MKNLTYIERLRGRQVDEGWSERRMAAELGVSYPTWHRIAAGKQQPTVPFLHAAMNRFPEYDPWVVFYLRGDVRTENPFVPTSDEDRLPKAGD